MNKSEAGKLGFAKTSAQLAQHRERQKAEAHLKYEQNPKYCLNCNTQIPYEKRYGKFCNASCSASYNNRINPKRVSSKSAVCSCGNPKLRTNKYCDECAQNHVYHKISSLEETKLDRVRKRILLEERGHRCEVCGLTEWMGLPIPIELDHIDGSSDNNTAANLRLICPNCHAQTATYKGSNMGKNSNRQQMRRKRYASGQTY